MSALLVLCLCAAWVPVLAAPTADAASASAPASIAPVTKTVTVNGETITVTAANVIMEGNRYGSSTALTLAIDTSKATFSSSLYVTYGDDNNYISQGYVNTETFYLDGYEKGAWNTFDFQITTGSDDVLAEFSLNIYVANDGEFALTDEEAQAETGSALVHSGSTSLEFEIGFSYDAALKGIRVYADLLDKDGNVCGRTYSDGALYETSRTDTRFADIYGTSPYSARILRAYGSLRCGRALTAGSYDLRVYSADGSGTFDKTVEDAVLVVDDPVVTISEGMAGVLHYVENEDGSALAGAYVQIVGGDPADLEVNLLKGDTVVATSNACRPIQVNYDGTLGVQYYIPIPAGSVLDEDAYLEELQRKVENGEITEEEYAALLAAFHEQALHLQVVRKDGGKLYGTTTTSESFTASSSHTGRSQVSGFTNHFLATALISVEGLDPDQTYRLVLCESWDDTAVLGEATASPDENGLFDVEFRDENGELVALEASSYSSSQYSVYFYPENSSNWMFQTLLYNRNVSAASEYSLSNLSVSSTNTVADTGITSARLENLGGGQVSLYVRGDVEALAELDTAKFQLSATPYGSTNTTVLNVAESNTENISRGYIYLYLDWDLPDGYYTLALLYGGKTVVNSEGVSIMGQNGPTLISEEVSIRSTDAWLPFGLLQPYSELQVYSGTLDAEEITADFYAIGNYTGTPDLTATLSGNGSWYSLDKAIPGQQYTVVFRDGNTILHVEDEFNYWLTSEQLSEYQRYYYGNGEIPNYSVTVDEELTGGTLTLTSCGGELGNALTEVYVSVKADRGYVLDHLLVNGEPIVGRTFLLTGDTVVSAVFSTAPTYTLTSEVYTGDYPYVQDDTAATISYTVDGEPVTSAMAGEEVTVTVTLASDDNLVNYLQVYSPDGSYLTSAAKQADGTWTFTMPAKDAVLKVYLRARYDLYINPHIKSGEGSFTVDNEHTMSANGYAVIAYGEGRPVTLTATPESGYCVAELYYEEWSSLTHQYEKISLIEEPATGSTTVTFTPKSTQMVVYVVFSKLEAKTITGYTSDYGTVTATVESAMPGDTVTLTVTPAEGYALKAGSLYVRSELGTITPTQNEDGTWSFTMPWADATVYATFIAYGPGGEVENPAELAAALGAAGTLGEDGTTVTLNQNVVMGSEIVVTGDAGILDLGRYTITGADDAEAVIRVTDGGALHVTNSGSNYGTIAPAADGRYGLIAEGGSLTVDGQLYIYASNVTEQDTSAALLVTGGTVTVGTQPAEGETASEYPKFYGWLYSGNNSAADGIRITGGTVTVYSGLCYGGTYYTMAEEWSIGRGDVSIMGADASPLGGGVTIGSSVPGGNGIHVSDEGALTIMDGKFIAGANQAGLKISAGEADTATGVIEIYGGQFNLRNASDYYTWYEGYGWGLWVDCAPTHFEITGGQFNQGDYNSGYWGSIKLKSSSLLNYLGSCTVTNLDTGREMTSGQLRSTSFSLDLLMTYAETGFAEGAELTDENVTITEDKGTVTIQVDNLTEQVVIVASFYNAEGQMIGISVFEGIRGTDGNITLEADLSGVATEVRVFLLEDGELIPIQEHLYWEVSSGEE